MFFFCALFMSSPTINGYKTFRELTLYSYLTYFKSTSIPYTFKLHVHEWLVGRGADVTASENYDERAALFKTTQTSTGSQSFW